MEYLPHEFTIGGVYFPPLLIASIFGTLAIGGHGGGLQSLPFIAVLLLSAAHLCCAGHHLYGVDRDFPHSRMNGEKFWRE